MGSSSKAKTIKAIPPFARNWLRRIRIHFRKILKTKTSANSIAWGFAIGSFIAIMPTPGISVLIGLALVLVFPRISKIALFLAMLIWNPFTIYPLYFVSFQLGNWMIGAETILDVDLSLMQRIQGYTIQFLAGNIIVASVLAGICYWVIYKLVLKYRELRDSKPL